MFKLRLLHGSHYQGTPVTKFVTGDVFENPKDLSKLFPNKFELVEGVIGGENSPSEKDDIESDSLSEDENVTEQNLRADDEYAPVVKVPIPGWENYVLVCQEGKDAGLLHKVSKKGRLAKVLRKILDKEQAAVWLAENV
jgi:hypothetical protein